MLVLLLLMMEMGMRGAVNVVGTMRREQVDGFIKASARRDTTSLTPQSTMVRF